MLTWGCMTAPSVIPTDLQGSFGVVLAKINSLTQNFPTIYSSDFTINNVDNTNPCLGKVVSLSTSLTQDRFVAASPADTSPGTLQDKMVAGTNVSFDFFATPGKLTLNSSGGASDHKVGSDITDISPDFLINKVESGLSAAGISVTPVLDTTTSRVAFNVNVDLVTLFTALLNSMTPGDALSQLFCTISASCPSPCSAPANVTVTYSSSGSSTTTTTTT